MVETTPRWARFGGILEGRVGDRGVILREVERINRIGLAEAELEFERDRYSLVLHDTPVAGPKVTNADKEELVESLQAIVDATQASPSPESTLHCVEVYTGEVVETVFGVQAGALRILSRKRPPLTQELAEPAEPPRLGSTIDRVGVRRVLLIGGFALLAFAGLAWQSGYLDRVFSPSAEMLTVDLGELSPCLKASVTDDWGMYRVAFERGSEYPTTTPDATAWVETASTVSGRAHRRAVIDGGTLFVRLVDDRGKPLSWGAVSFARLLEGPGTSVEVRVLGRLGAHHLDLTLTEPMR